MIHPSVPPSRDIAQDASQLVESVSQSVNVFTMTLAEVLGDLSDSSIADQTVDGLHTATGVNKSLVWKIKRLQQARQPIEEIEAVPGRRAVSGLAKIASSRGIEAEKVNRLLEASDRFEQLVTQTASDRELFVTTVRGCADQLGPESQEVMRKKAFTAMSQLLGVSLGRMHLSMFMGPGANPEDNAVAVTLLMNVGRTHYRPDVYWPIVSISSHDNNPEHQPVVPPRRPIRPGPQLAEGISLLDEFAQGVQPKTRVTERHGNLVVEATSDVVGKAGRFTAAYGSILSTTGPKPDIDLYRFCRVPCEEISVDLWVHRQFVPQAPLTGRMYYGGEYEYDPKSNIGVVIDEQTIAATGYGPTYARNPGLPNSKEFFDLGCTTGGWDPAEMCLYRYRLACPTIPGTLRLYDPSAE
ncbi:MAG: hypothetical protein AAGA29_09850 [Planctomycetota bacterium]